MRPIGNIIMEILILQGQTGDIHEQPAAAGSSFITKINNHCRDLHNTRRELNEDATKAYQTKARLTDNISPSEKAAYLKYFDDYNRRIQTNEEKLKNAKPCIRRDCRPHDGNRNLCAHIKNHQTRIQQLNSIALTFIDILEQMKENHLELTTQYFDDNSKLQEIQADIKNLEDLDELGSCPIPECNKRTPDSEEHPFQTADKKGGDQ
ncbi:hypothetical protein HNY73_005681 [Argiope bruennichi]|uniref:Uncharacterized protein n=1 Tax=Argiope bruennichi TaxID=94029 RepID=A0A8T0FMA5_ARGBR|nr:hypothetical protein HNY73_005681 [Argiope bruennichi]